jgi:hypothetical protein
MAAGTYSFTIEQGATTDFEIQYKDSGSNAIDLGGGQYAEMRLYKIIWISVFKFIWK